MNDGNGKDIERWLRSVTLKPSAPDLREKILEAAQKVRRTTLLTPRLRLGFAASALILAVIFPADAVLSRKEKRFIQAYGVGTTIVSGGLKDQEILIAEILGDSLSESRFFLTKYPPSPDRKSGLIGLERLRDKLIKEDFNGTENPQSSF